MESPQSVTLSQESALASYVRRMERMFVRAWLWRGLYSCQGHVSGTHTRTRAEHIGVTTPPSQRMVRHGHDVRMRGNIIGMLDASSCCPACTQREDGRGRHDPTRVTPRSEEHTSELQSPK